MFANIIGWFLKRKLVDENGEYFYGKISITKIAVVALGVMRASESLSVYLAQQGIIPHPIALPASLYEIVGGIATVAARDAIVHQAAPASSVPASVPDASKAA